MFLRPKESRHTSRNIGEVFIDFCTVNIVHMYVLGVWWVCGCDETYKYVITLLIDQILMLPSDVHYNWFKSGHVG